MVSKIGNKKMLLQGVIPEPCAFEAAFYGNLRELKQALDKGQDPASKNYTGATPFHIAAANGHIEFLEFLLEKGYNINDCDRNGCTALHLAARNGQLDTIKFLVNKGGDVKLETKKGRSVLAVALRQADRERQRPVIDFLKKSDREKMSWEID